MLSLSSILSNGEIQKLFLESESKEGQNTGSVGGWNGSQVAAQLTLTPRTSVSVLGCLASQQRIARISSLDCKTAPCNTSVSYLIFLPYLVLL